MKTMVEIRNLRHHHNSQKKNPLNIDCLEVDEGQTLALFGSSGAGKTTTLRLIAGLLTADFGTIRIGGADVSELAPNLRRVGMVFQEPLLFPFNSVIDNVGFAGRVRREPTSQARKDALEFLDLVGLADFAQRDIRTLSGGQAQRVALARALAARPLLLLLDEPFSALDVDLRSEMQEMLQRVRNELRLTMILVTHDQREAAILADTVALISNGKILQQGKIEELFSRPSSQEVHRIMGGKNEVVGIIKNGNFHSDLGVMSLPAGAAADGLAQLLFRHESVQMESSVSRHEEAFVGEIIQSRSIGVRVELTARVRSTVLRFEVVSSMAPEIGEQVSIYIPVEDRWTVPVASQVISPKDSTAVYSLVSGAI
jgi:putative spermidine/putrescine transport system ATP-binding protein